MTCRSCHRDVPIGVKEFPYHSILVECCLCGETQRYRPSDMVLAIPHRLVLRRERLEARSRNCAPRRVVMLRWSLLNWLIGGRLLRNVIR